MKKIFLILIVLFLSGCNYRELDKIAITVGCGLEKVDDGYKITVQIADTQKQGDSNSSTSPVRFKNYTYTDRTIHEAARGILTKLPKKAYTKHMQILVIDEKIANNGINEIIDFWFREVELRNDFYVFVSKDSTPIEVLGVLTQIYPINSVGIRNLIENNFKYLGGTVLTTFDDLTSSYISKTKEIILPTIVVLGKDGNKKDNLESSIPESLISLSETAYFRDNKLVGYLDKKQTIYYNLVKNALKTSIISYECDKDKFVTFEIIENKTDIDIVKNKPEVNIKVQAKGNLTSIMCEYDISKNDGIKMIEKEGSLEIKKQIDSLFKLSKDNKTDIFSIRDIYYKHNNKYYKNISNYNDFFDNLKVNVDVKLNIFEKGNSLQVIANEKNK
ncbi:ger(X)C family germination protein [Firmicutes bacterium CAG:884]|nr:Ger(x)C family spore germination protein [Bacillota bacterium]CCY94342.1 ger(X)C family germination protein [Firmicutes bacterium CAG:884]